MGLDQRSAIRENAIGCCHLERRHANFLADCERSNRRWLPAVERAQNARRFPGQIDPGARSKSQPLHVLVHRFVADHKAEFDRANVTRFRQSVSYCNYAIRMTIVNQAAGDSDRTHLTIDLVIRFYQPLFNRGRVSNYFERRAWFVDTLQSSVLTRFGG